MPATRSLSRRDLLRGAARPRMVFAEAPGAGDVLVVIFLRGAMDGVHTVPPFADPSYQRQRPTLAIADPGKAAGAVDLDGFFGLHPDLAPLAELFQEKRLAVVHACGSPDTTLSHFEAMQTMERGVSDGNSTASGWISRHLATRETGNSSPMRAVAFGDVLPKSLQGSTQATAVRSLSEFRLAVPDGWPSGYRDLLTELYPGEGDAARTAGGHIFELLGRLDRLKPDDYAPSGGAAYPETDLGRGLKQVAQLIKADVGLEIASVDLGGWDAHVAQVTLMSGLMQDLGKSLHAFHADLERRMKRVTVVAMTEFGRRVHENSGLGTDHGRGSAMFLLGGGIRGGKVYGRWPGLSKDELDRDGNLRVTTDYRDILGEIVERRLHNPHLDRVFPDWQPRYLGLTA
ncbi:MAG: DUF1501 domain-containing protein [Armatimonadota bacterium]